ncbi:trypsin-like peptidase domain-containing protein [Psychroserpens luteolus]|uniref:trypsin-like peptidase domain-containing protein n=1 Tax=Psychroserpens luteolus TaxID=2855840 RepID=UPI001E3BC260|nr:trypsin-like peptidase domain-containing protein [Psychroserpens luteolus]MCD2259304.1 trypsin-like peptidase domain-containing protein [Psychroserpens luteolus]
MKKILTLVFVSVLGGIIALSTYTHFIEKEQIITVTESSNEPQFLNASYNTKTANLINGEQSDFTLAAENTINSVVHVKNTSIVSGALTFEDLFYGRRSQRAQVGTGSGVIIDKNGYIITNNHVIAGASNISITLNDNRVFEAELIGTDEKTDIALLKIDAEEDLPAIEFGDSDHAKVGEWVLAVGNPFNLTSTVTAGIISAKSRDLSGRNSQSFIQTDAAVNPGNSGGALVNSNGRLIGINTAISSRTGSYIGYSFAVPSNIARKVVQDIMEYGDVQEGVLGVSILNRNSDEAKELGVSEIQGVYISNVEDNSGAKKAGIKNGDIIRKLDNVAISKFSDLSGYIKTKRPNDVVNVEIERDSKVKIIPVTLSKSDIISVEFINMELRNLPSKLKKDYNIKNGVIVQDNKNKFLYSKLGIRRGYIITGINDITIHSVEDITKFTKKYGENAQENIFKLEYLNTDLERKEVIFR